MENYRTGKFDYEVVDGYCLTVDCGQAGVEGYALALLRIFNTARENPKLIYKIANSYGTDDILVYCPKKSLNSVKEYCNGIHPYYDKANGTVTYVGEVKDVLKCKFALIDYDIDLLDDGSDDVVLNEWIVRK